MTATVEEQDRVLVDTGAEALKRWDGISELRDKLAPDVVVNDGKAFYKGKLMEPGPARYTFEAGDRMDRSIFKQLKEREKNDSDS